MSSSTSNDCNNKNLLPEHYVLSEYDVYCGRGSQCFNHEGNRKFRQTIIQYLDRYMIAKSKYDKSSIIDEIVATVRCNNGGGGFVKKDEATGRFYDVGDYMAREKTSQAFRDAIQERSKQMHDVIINKKSSCHPIIHNTFQTTNVTTTTTLANSPASVGTVVGPTKDFRLFSTPLLDSYAEKFVSSSNVEKQSLLNTTASSSSIPSKLMNQNVESILDLLSTKQKHLNASNINDSSSVKNIPNHHVTTLKQDHFNKAYLENCEHYVSGLQQFHGTDANRSSWISNSTEITAQYTKREVSIHFDQNSMKVHDYAMSMSGLDKKASISTFHQAIPDAASPSDLIIMNLTNPSLKDTTVDDVISVFCTNESLTNSSNQIPKQDCVMNNNITLLPSNNNDNDNDNSNINNNISNDDNNNSNNNDTDNTHGDAGTFDILLQLTQTYPDLETCPFLKLNDK